MTVDPLASLGSDWQPQLCSARTLPRLTQRRIFNPLQNMAASLHLVIGYRSEGIDVPSGTA